MFTKRLWLVVPALIGMILLAVPCSAGILSPLEVTGYNIDGVYGPAGGQGGGFAQTIEYGGRAFFAAGTLDINGTPHSDGLPIGNFTSNANPDNTYCLAAAGGDEQSNNVLRLGFGMPMSGTLSLVNPGKFDSIGVLMTSTDGNSSATITLNYSDSTTADQNVMVLNWDSASSGAVCVARSKPVAGVDSFEYDSGPGAIFWVQEFIVDADPAKTLNSVTITSNSGNSCLSALAVSGHVPEPGTLALAVIGAMGLMVYAWRKARQ